LFGGADRPTGVGLVGRSPARSAWARNANVMWRSHPVQRRTAS